MGNNKIIELRSYINFPDVKKKIDQVKRLLGQASQKNEIIWRIRDAPWDVHVDLTPFKGVMNFHVRRYERGGNGVLITTKQWVTLKHSR